jgi:hypothetical protein
MQPVGVDCAPVGAVTAEAEAWGRLVDNYVQPIWDLCLGEGLDATEAAQVSQVIWLKLAQRWPIVRDQLDQTAQGGGGIADLERWIGSAVLAEAEGVLEQRFAAQFRAAPMPNVVCLSPGFSPPEPRSRRH